MRKGKKLIQNGRVQEIIQARKNAVMTFLRDTIYIKGVEAGYNAGYNDGIGDGTYKGIKKIEVGDEVVNTATHERGVVVVKLNDEEVVILVNSGYLQRMLIATVMKTGRHFDEVNYLLEKMK